MPVNIRQLSTNAPDFEGEFQRRQDGNYNGGFKQYFTHQGEVREKMQANFEFGSKAQ